MRIVLSKHYQEELKKAASIQPLSANGECADRTIAIDILVQEAKEKEPKAFILCPMEKRAMKPNAAYTKCAGQSLDGKTVCDARDVCKRYVQPPAKQYQAYAEFWRAGDKCQNFDSAHK